MISLPLLAWWEWLSIIPLWLATLGGGLHYCNVHRLAPNPIDWFMFLLLITRTMLWTIRVCRCDAAWSRIDEWFWHLTCVGLTWGIVTLSPAKQQPSVAGTMIRLGVMLVGTSAVLVSYSLPMWSSYYMDESLPLTTLVINIGLVLVLVRARVRASVQVRDSAVKLCHHKHWVMVILGLVLWMVATYVNVTPRWGVAVITGCGQAGWLVGCWYLLSSAYPAMSPHYNQLYG
jgi:hypothetical protein